jgi:hypothetical protein
MNNISFPWDTQPNNYTVQGGANPLITEDSESEVEDETNLINFGDNLSVTLDSSGEITVDATGGSATDTRVNSTDSGSNAVTDVKNIDFATNLSYTVGGTNNNEITVTAAGGLTFFQVPRAVMDNDTWAVGARFRIPDGDTKEFTAAGVQTDSSTAPTGLKIQLYDDTNDTLLIDANSIYTSGSPLASVTGPVDVEIRVENLTGSKQTASGFITMGTGGGGSSSSSDKVDFEDGSTTVEDPDDVLFTANQSNNATANLEVDVSSDGSGGAEVDYSFVDTFRPSPIDAWATIVTDLSNPSNSAIKGTNVTGVQKLGRGVWRVGLSSGIGSSTASQDPDLEVQVSSSLGWTSNETSNSTGMTWHTWQQAGDNSNPQANEVDIRFRNENGNVADPVAFSIKVIDV